MPLRVALSLVVLALLSPAPALASLADEQSQGRTLVSQLRSGAKSCGDLSATDFEHVGEYVMGRALGSTSAHEAMNTRMRQYMGEQGEERMHQLMGERFTGCASGGGAVMGPGMMGGYSGNGGWGSMMSSGDWSWMAGNAWRGMSRQDWQRLQRRWMGSSGMSGGHHGWSTAAVVVVVGAIFLTAFAVFALIRRPVRRPPAASTP
jgi:hypothetical protein